MNYSNFVLYFTTNVLCIMAFVQALDNVQRISTGDTIPGSPPCPNNGTRVVKDGGSRPNQCVTKMNDPIAGKITFHQLRIPLLQIVTLILDFLGNCFQGFHSYFRKHII